MFYSAMQIENSACLLNVLLSIRPFNCWDELGWEKYILLVKDSPQIIFCNLAWDALCINDDSATFFGIQYDSK